MKLIHSFSKVVQRTAAPRGLKREQKQIQDRYRELAHEEFDHVEILNELVNEFRGHPREEIEDIAFSGVDEEEPKIVDKVPVWPPRAALPVLNRGNGHYAIFD